MQNLVRKASQTKGNMNINNQKVLFITTEIERKKNEYVHYLTLSKKNLSRSLKTRIASLDAIFHSVHIKNAQDGGALS